MIQQEEQYDHDTSSEVVVEELDSFIMKKNDKGTKNFSVYSKRVNS